MPYEPDPIKGPQSRATAVTEALSSDKLQSLLWSQVQDADEHDMAPEGQGDVTVNRSQLAALLNYVEDLEGALMKSNDDVDGTSLPKLRPRE